MKKALSLDTILVHGGYDPADHNRSRMVPLYQTAAFCYDSTDHAAALFSLDQPGHIYQRIDNPTVAVAEKRIAAAEKGLGAVGFASGMAAVTGFILNFLSSGDEIAASVCLYGGSMGLLGETLPPLGIKVKFFDPHRPGDLKKIINKRTRLVFVENLANPALSIPDYKGITEVCRAEKLPLAVDNTVATPYLAHPADAGADFILHSGTKYLEGHGTITGGFVIDTGRFTWTKERYPLLFDKAPGGLSWVDKYGPEAFLYRLRGKILMNTGGCMAPLHAWLLVHGMESLHVRMPRHCSNALYLAEALANHPGVAWVNYPGLPGHRSHELAKLWLRNHFGGMLGFGLKGGYEMCRKMIGRIKLISHCTNIGDAKSLIIHPASTTHRNMTPLDRVTAGIGDDFIRLSVGLEEADDLYDALDEAITAKDNP
jgi:O-acetylhomoserine (thiol)-lyase